MYLFRNTPLNPRKEIRAVILKVPGIGWRKSVNIVSKAGLAHPYILNNIKPYQFGLLAYLLKIWGLSPDRIKRRMTTNIDVMINNNSYHGMRHKLSLPVRGQRSRTNAGTQRAKRVRVSSSKKSK